MMLFELKRDALAAMIEHSPEALAARAEAEWGTSADVREAFPTIDEYRRELRLLAGAATPQDLARDRAGSTHASPSRARSAARRPPLSSVGVLGSAREPGADSTLAVRSEGGRDMDDVRATPNDGGPMAAAKAVEARLAEAKGLREKDPDLTVREALRRVARAEDGPRVPEGREKGATVTAEVAEARLAKAWGLVDDDPSLAIADALRRVVADEAAGA